MRSYVDLYFAPESVSPLDLAQRIRERAGLEFIIGPHDLVFEWTSVEAFRATLAGLREALQGSGVLYRVETVPEETTFVEPIPWPPPIRSGTPSPHPAYDRSR